MAEDSNLPIQPQSNSLVKAGGLIKVTNKLLSESNFEFYGDFKGNTIWKTDTKVLDTKGKKVFVPKYDEYFLTYGDGHFNFWSKETGSLIRTSYLGNYVIKDGLQKEGYRGGMDNICLMENEKKQLANEPNVTAELKRIFEKMYGRPMGDTEILAKIRVIANHRNRSLPKVPQEDTSLDDSDTAIQIFFYNDQTRAINTVKINIDYSGSASPFYLGFYDDPMFFVLYFWHSLSKDKIFSYGGGDNQINIWDIKNHVKIHSFLYDEENDSMACCPICYHEDKLLIVLTGCGFLQIWNIETGKKEEQISIDNERKFFRNMALCEISKSLVIWDSSIGRIDFWSLEKGKCICNIIGIESLIDCEFSSDGNYLFVLTIFNGLKIYETKTYHLIVDYDFDIDYSQKDCDYPSRMGIDHSRKEIYVSTEKGMLYKIN